MRIWLLVPITAVIVLVLKINEPSLAPEGCCFDVQRPPLVEDSLDSKQQVYNIQWWSLCVSTSWDVNNKPYHTISAWTGYKWAFYPRKFDDLTDAELMVVAIVRRYAPLSDTRHYIDPFQEHKHFRE